MRTVVVLHKCTHCSALVSSVMDSLFLYVIKQIYMDHLPFAIAYMYYIKWLGLKFFETSLI